MSRFLDNDQRMIAFRVPVTLSHAIDNAAGRRMTSRSALMREALLEKLGLNT